MLFLISSIILALFFSFVAPRRLSWIEILVTTWFGLYFEAMVNIFLDLKYDLYGYFKKGVDWVTLVPLLGIYPPLSYLVLNFFPTGKGIIRIAIYLIFWDAISVAYEQFAIRYGVFYYNGWTWWYSAILYPPIFIALRLHLAIARMLIRKSKNSG